MTNAALIAMDPDRRAIEVAGPDAETFLQSLLTNSTPGRDDRAPRYAALLTPKGKFLADFMVWRTEPERFLLETGAALFDTLLKRLTLYKLRADVAIAAQPGLGAIVAWRADGAPLEPALGGALTAVGADPRDAALGLRALAENLDAAALAWADALGGESAPIERYHAHRIARLTPLGGVDLRVEESFVLEHGFDRLNGVDYKKGCFVGQEIVARMRHKTELKKALYRVRVAGDAAPGAELVTESGKPAGVLGSRVGDDALAHLRIDRAGEALRAGDVAVAVVESRDAPTPE